MTERASDDNFLRTGDLITLKFVRFQSYLSGEGILSEDIYVSQSTTTFEDHLFQVCAQRQYSAKLEYADFEVKQSGKEIKDDATKKHFAALIRGKSNEMRMNEVYMKHKIGNNVLFGDIVQLLHVKSRKYLTVKPGTLARDERENMCVHLSSEGNVFSWIQLLPRYKIDREGDRISNNTELVMHVSERPSENIHCADRAPGGRRLREVNASMESGSPWRLNIFQSSKNGIDPALLNAGQLVYIRDPEFFANLQVFVGPVDAKALLKAAEEEQTITGDHPDEGSVTKSMASAKSPRSDNEPQEEENEDEEEAEDESINSADEFVEDYGKIILKPANEDALDSNSIWVLESKSLVRGGPIQWKQDQVYLRHLNTGKYLSTLDTGEDEYVMDSCLFTIVDEPTEKHSLFTIYELHSQNDSLQTNKAIQLRQGHMFVERSDYVDRWKSFTCAGTRNRMKATNLIITRYAEHTGQSNAQINHQDMAMDIHVGISIRNVLKSFLEVTRVPSVRDSKTSSIWAHLDPTERAVFASTVELYMYFIKGFPIVHDEHIIKTYIPRAEVIKRRQSLFREQEGLKILLLLLAKLTPISERLASGDAAAHQFNEGGLLFSARNVVSTSLRLLAEMTRNNSENQMYVAEFMGVVLAHCSSEKLAAEITQEMLSSNRELQETKMGPDEIVVFSEKLRDSQMSAMFLRLIQSCCSCQGAGVSHNQVNIANIILGRFASEFIVVNTNFENTRAMEWSSFPSSSLYLPSPGSVDVDYMLGSSLYTKGSPSVSLTWINSDKRLNPMSLFGKRDVKIWELYEEFIKLTRVQNGSGLFATSGSSSNEVIVTDAKTKETQFKLAAGEFFGAQLSLAADMCLDRNYTVIAKLVNLYPYEALLSIIRKPNTPSFVKASCLSLLTNMYVDCDPQVKITLPRLTRTWTELSAEDTPMIRNVDDSVKYRFGLLQVMISEHVRQLNGRPFSLETRQIMILLHRLLSFSFYGTSERLLDVIDPIVSAVDRRHVSEEDNIGILLEQAALPLAEPKTRGRINSRIDAKRRASTTDEKVGEDESKTQSDDKIFSESDNADGEEGSFSGVKARWQERLLAAFESLYFTSGMLVLVVVSVALAIYEYVTGEAGIVIEIVEYIISAAFAIDILVRAYCSKIVRGSLLAFSMDAFNIVDMAVVIIDIVSYVEASSSGDTTSSNRGFTKIIKIVRLLRLFRVLRIFRILNAIAANLTGVEIFKVEWKDPPRYYKSSLENTLTMVEICKILGTVQLIVEDRNVSLLMSGFYQWYTQLPDGDQLSEESIELAVETFKEVSNRMLQLRVSNDAYDDIFIDLMMYNSRELVQTSMNILMTHHSSKKVLLMNANRLQLLVNHRREQQYQKLDGLLVMLKRVSDTHDIWGRLLTAEHKRTSEEAHRALKDIKIACYRRREVLKFDEEFEPDKTIQDILRNLGCFDVCMKIARLIGNIDPHNLISEQSRNTRTLVLEASELLYWFTLGNEQNQALSYKQLAFFLKNIDEKVKTHKVIEAIFYQNEFLMKSLPKSFITEGIEMILNQGRFMQYLSLLGAIVASGTKNMIENQYEIIRILASPGNLKKVLLYFVPVSHPEYQKKLKAMNTAANTKDVSIEDLPSDLSYHLGLMTLLSGCTVGRENMTTIEAKVQSMFSFVDVVEAIIDPHAILLTKIRTGLFFYNSMLDVEMRLPSLKDAKCVWDLLETFTEVFSFAKDDLRQIEKNGWAASSSSRQKVEWVIVCAMITHGYFKYYFDATVFRPEVGQASVVERVHIREKKAYEFINGLFFKIRSVYEMQSPLLDVEHQEVLYNAMCALNNASATKIVITVENLHESVVVQGETHSGREEVALRRFLSAIADHQHIAEMLSDETQEFIAKIEKLPRIDDATSSSDVRYEALLKRIIAHIGGSIQTQVHGEEVVKFIDEQATRTNLWFIRMFRTMIENKWGMTIYERDDDGGEEQDIAAGDVMRTLNNCGVTNICLSLLGRGVDDELQAEAIKLIVALLFKEGGAHDVQVTINETLNRPGSELFFLHVRSMLADLMAWHKWQGVVVLEEGCDPELPEEIILVRMLQLMCEGHYKPNQDIMREQPNNRISVNLLDDFVQYLQILDENKCRTSTAAANAVTATVLEVIQGPCELNQDYFALSTELLETLNRRMRHHVIGDCVEDEENEIKKTAIDIFQGLLEGQGRRPAIYDRVLSVIHLDVIKMITIAEPAEGEEESETFGELKMECLVFLMLLFDFKPSLRAELEMEEEESEVACVEVVWRGELQRRFFNVPEICADIAKSSKDDFIASADRESAEAKLYDLINVAHSMHREVLHQQLLKEWGVASVFSRTNMDRSIRLMFVLALIINILFIAYYANVPCDNAGLKDDDGHFPTCQSAMLPVLDSGVDINDVTLGLGILLIVLAVYTVLLSAVMRLPVKYESFIEKGEGPWTAAINTAMDGKTLYYIGYLIFAILSINSSYHHLMAFLLLDMISMSPVTQDTLNAIWKPRRMLIMTLLLTFILVYIYAIMSFFLLNNTDNFVLLDENTLYPDQPNMNTLFHAFKEFLRYGSPSGQNNNIVVTIFTARWVMDVTFYMVCFTMWNVIKGITIDTFVELRRDLSARIEDTEEKCFICGIEKLVFNRALDRTAFDTHIKKDQNLWNYVFYCIFIWEQDKDDDDGLEYYVRHCVEDGDLSWFPMNKAIRLAEHLEKGEADSLPAKFRGDLRALEDAVDVRMGVLKDQLQRSITRVEQALAYQPDVSQNKLKKKRTKNNVENTDADSVQNSTTTMSRGSPSRVGSSPFRPMTGSVAADFAKIMEGDMALFTPDTEVDVALQQREKSLDFWRTQAYMDQMQLHVACNELDGLYVTQEMIGHLSIRLVSDTGVFICSSGFDSGSSLAESIKDARNNRAVKANEPIPFNKSEYFVVHGGPLKSGDSRAMIVQVLMDKKVDIPQEVADAYPSVVHRCLAYGSLPICDILEVIATTGSLQIQLKQFGEDRTPCTDCVLRLNATASDNLVSEYQAQKRK